MGVPSLYKWLTHKYPEIKLKIDPSEHQHTDNLYLDFNAIIHPCCNKSLDSMQSTDSELYRNLEEFLDDIMNRIKPRRLLYISIDGVAPRAKLNQQRARRFTHAKEVKEEGKFYFKDDCGSEPSGHRGTGIINNVDALSSSSAGGLEAVEETEGTGSGVFDTNAITPGTEFMHRLDLFLQEIISYKISTDEKWRDINVIYSSYRVPGEGEQKIMQYIRTNQNPSQVSVIFSPDADLIFLGLTLFEYNVLILRDEPKKGVAVQNTYVQSARKEYSLLSISKLKSILTREFKALIKVPFDQRRFLEDWVLLCFSVGNDFLPCTPCFEIRTNALDKLTSILQAVYLRTRSFITDRGKINYAILREFFKECAVRENQYIAEKRNNLIQTRQRMNIPFNQSEEFFLDNERGKVRFYVEKMGIRSEEELLNACKEYIRGLEWVYNYYFYDIPSWDWYYPYHFAPFMADLALVKDVTVTFPKSKPLRPMEQLLAVLPPLSKDLLPKCLHKIFETFRSMYPTEFKIDMFQKCMDWQAIAILPFLNTGDIVSAFEKHQNELSFLECERNITGYPLMFSRQPKVVAKVYSVYTELRPYEILETDGVALKIFPINKISGIDEEVESCGFKYVNKAVKFNFDQRKSYKKVSSRRRP